MSIQNTQRRRIAHRKVHQMRREKDAAIKIQAIQRGKVTRKRINIAVNFIPEGSNLTVHEVEYAAIKLQAIQRGSMGKRRTQRQRKRRRAAITIQARTRGRAERKLQAQRHALAKPYMCHEEKQYRVSEIHDFATIIQAIWRVRRERYTLQNKRLARKQMEKEKANRLASDMKAQFFLQTEIEKEQRRLSCAYKINDKVEVLSNGSWYIGNVTKVRGRKTKFCYDIRYKNGGGKGIGVKVDAMKPFGFDEHWNDDLVHSATVIQRAQRVRVAKRRVENKRRNQSAAKLQRAERQRQARQKLRSKRAEKDRLYASA